MSDKPVKRHNAIAPLSRDHHAALVFALRLKNGVIKGADTGELAAYVSHFWFHHLVPHFRDEEEVFFPESAHPLINRALDEHVRIKALVDNIAVKPDGETMLALSKLLNEHVRFEERTLFNALEKDIKPENMEKIARVLLHHDLADAPAFPRPFWL